MIIESGIMALIAPVVISVATLVLMMQIAFWRNATVSWVIACLSILVAMLVLIFPLTGGDGSAQQITPLLIADSYSDFFSILILFACLITSLLAKDYLQSRTGENEEFYLLLMLSGLGALILVSSTHLASFLLGLELLGVALYALIAYPERGHLPLEAAVKYLILSGAASAILLFGFALIYAALGTLSFVDIGHRLAHSSDNQVLLLMGTAMIFAGIGFKLSLVPFHMWTPDVYQGAPSPVTGFLATVSKSAIFAALMRFYIDAQLYQYHRLLIGIAILAVASMVIGNLLALKQNNLKRLLAYSSIAHLGYLLITMVVYGRLQQPGIAVEAINFYLAAYVVTSLAAFALLTILSSPSNANAAEGSISAAEGSSNTAEGSSNTAEGSTITAAEGSTITAEGSHLYLDAPEEDHIDDVRGLFWRQPILALLLTISMLSLAGIPLTVGFIGKFYLFTAGISAELWVLLGALVIGSGIGIYYYLRVVFSMTAKVPEETSITANLKMSSVAMPVVWILIVGMLYLGIFPQSFIEYLAGVVL